MNGEIIAYDTNGRLLSRTHLLGSTPLGGHTYTLDALGRRTAETGGTGVSPVNRTFGYDPLGQVTAASYGTGLSDTYAYDKAGNRNSSSIASLGGASTLYTANNANQYTAITGVSQPISYDANGNLNLRNGNSYTWDSHNRLLSVIPQNPVAGSKSLHYTYDGFHRRVLRTIRVWQPSNQWTDLDSTRFFYDGWNVIEEHTITAGTQTLARTFTWGSDLSGTLQGAGGVGGLLLAEEVSGGNTTARHYHYDGNGNVTEITDLAGAKVASYRYDAYGNTLAASGPYSAQNRYRFSTKPLDGEVTGAPLYYYGYRFYDPITGSWLSRDPIEEEGGVNLYGFVGNDGICAVDSLGLESTKITINGKKSKTGKGYEKRDLTVQINIPPIETNWISDGEEWNEWKGTSDFDLPSNCSWISDEKETGEEETKFGDWEYVNQSVMRRKRTLYKSQGWKRDACCDI